jgi:RNA 3'-terminal phosphate cyclase (ATP)
VEPEALAQAALAELAAWEHTGAPVGEHLADQLLLPMALYGGELRTGPLSLHARTNIEVIERFLPVHFSVDEGRVRVET